VTDTDNRVRLAIYEWFVEEGEPPSAPEVAAALAISTEDAQAAFRRLEESHVIVLMPGTLEVWMANPLSSVPTAFHVETPQGSFWGNCIWDGLGTVAMLGGDGAVETRCADCEEPMTLRLEEYKLIDAEGLAHFAVPAARWWENIGFT
jgi:hypothetical protein